jgi:ferredoxin/flavodoxin---NADP+ reductase
VSDATQNAAEAAVAPLTAPQLNAVVLQREEVASGLLIIRVAAKDWAVPAFKPGQYATLGLPGAAPRIDLSDPDDPPVDPQKLIRRAYSVASSSHEGEYLEFFVTLVRSGSLTPRLFALRPGDQLFLGQKITGMFTLDMVRPDANLVLAATGTGLAPYMSMLRTLLPTLQARRIAVIHGARHSWDLAYRAELTTMQRLCPWFSYIPVVADPAAEPVAWAGRVGFVQDAFAAGVVEKAWGSAPKPDDTHVFLCGNPLMVTAMLEHLTAAGFVEHSRKTPGQVHLERFW